MFFDVGGGCPSADRVEGLDEPGCGVLGVIDGSSPTGVESDADVAWRHDLLRNIGYKR